MIKYILALSLLLTGCTSKTEHGSCVGVTEDKKPYLVYKPAIWNIVVGMIFFETILIPTYVVLYEFQCPVEKN